MTGDSSTASTSSGNPLTDSDEEDLKLAIEPEEQRNFDSLAYLRCFYENMSDTEPAMQFILSFMPGIASRIETPCGRMLDIGSGPTVYMAMIFRKMVDNIYLSDYAASNIAELGSWLKGDGRFDWTNVARKIALHEGLALGAYRGIEAEARRRIRGVYQCDVFSPGVIIPTNVTVPFPGVVKATRKQRNEPHNASEKPIDLSNQKSDGDQPLAQELSAKLNISDPKKITKGASTQEQFDLVTSVFCLEYAGTTSEQYAESLRNVIALIKPGGRLVLGGVMEDHYYKFNYVVYRCHYLTEAEFMDQLKKNGIDLDDNYQYYNQKGVFLFSGRKRS